MTSFKRLSCFFVFLLLCGCSGSTKTAATPNLENQDRVKNFLTKFKEISADTIKVISSLNFEDDHYRFKGVLLDSTDVNLLPDEFSKTYRSDKNFYACLKFSMDDTHTGLIIRTPSMYTPSSIKLFVFDTLENKILEPYIELAETVVQMVEYWDKKTFIVKDKKSGTTFLMWERQNEDTTEIFYSIRFKNEKFDTVSVVQK